MSSEKPFVISIPNDKLDLLQRKLALARLPNELDDAGWSYGVPLADMRRLVNYWKDGFDWRAQEAMINAELPQFTQDIEVEGFGTLNIHYIHQTSTAVGAIPLLFVHGWPGSFLEARKILPILTANNSEHPSFHVVALSLPGYGFSQAPSKKGFLSAQYAEVANKLMVSLGYIEYVTQGGDWGSMLTRRMALTYGGKHVKAWHTNTPLAFEPTEPPSTPYSEAEKANLKRGELFQQQEIAYSTLQSTKPQTLGYSLEDSPVGLLAWMYEKMRTWSDNYAWTDDEGPSATLRIYRELFQSGDFFGLVPQKPPVPMGISIFPGDFIISPLSWYKLNGNVVFSNTEHSKGGHFGAYENPDGLTDDLRKMFGKGGACFGVVSGKTGY